MQFYIVALFILGCLYQTSCTPPAKVPVLFVTEEDIPSGSKDINYFYLRLCGGDLYDKQVATVYINQPNKPWSPIVGDYIKMAIFDAAGHQIATNKGSSDYVETFTFKYYKTYGDLKIRGTTPPTPGGVLYTITIRFPEKALDFVQNGEARYMSTAAEMQDMMEFERAVENVHAGKTYELVSVFLTSVVGTVQTQLFVLLELDYCFLNTSLPGTIEVSVIAVDETSGFATYVCPGHFRPCSVEAPFSDTSGAAVNFVTAAITQHEDVGPVQVFIRGDGRFGVVNSYKLSASKFRKNKKM